MAGSDSVSYSGVTSSIKFACFISSGDVTNPDLKLSKVDCSVAQPVRLNASAMADMFTKCLIGRLLLD